MKPLSRYENAELSAILPHRHKSYCWHDKDQFQDSETMQEMSRRGFLGTAGMAAVVPSVAAIAAQGAGLARGSGSIEKNVVYGKAGNIDLHLDIYRPPEGTEKRMAMIHIHGGGFTAGSKDTLADRVAPSVARGDVGI